MKKIILFSLLICSPKLHAAEVISSHDHTKNNMHVWISPLGFLVGFANIGFDYKIKPKWAVGTSLGIFSQKFTITENDKSDSSNITLGKFSLVNYLYAREAFVATSAYFYQQASILGGNITTIGTKYLFEPSVGVGYLKLYESGLTFGLSFGVGYLFGEEEAVRLIKLIGSDRVTVNLSLTLGYSF